MLMFTQNGVIVYNVKLGHNVIFRFRSLKSLQRDMHDASLTQIYLGRGCTVVA